MRSGGTCAENSYGEVSCGAGVNLMQIFQGNYVDLVILVVLLYFVTEAWREGFWAILSDFLGFLFSLLISLRFFSSVGLLLRSNFSLSHTVSNALGFLLVASLAETFFAHVFYYFLKKLPAKFWTKPWNNILATLPALGQGVIMVSFALVLIISFPVSPVIKNDVSESKIGGYLLQKTSGTETKIKEVFGGLIEDSLTYLTVKPGSGETVSLKVKVLELSVDEKAEVEMFKMVNEERKKRGIKELVWRSDVVPVARNHASDMWKRNYFGHISPDGKDAGDRLNDANVSYQMAGENLALAPTLQTAHTGLMNSEGHRANILDPDFRRVGIGVIANGYYGKIFVQVFTD